MTITYFASASNPADNGTLDAAATRAVTPPASMQAGDLVYLVAEVRHATIVPALSELGGQSWTSGTVTQGGSTGARAFWCTFNGTWDADPSVEFPAGNDTHSATLAMHVWRPSAGSTWSVDVAETRGNIAAPSTPFDITLTGVTTVGASTVSIFTWFSPDDNTWALQSGDFSNAGGAQYRNTAGADQSLSTAYRILTAQGATGDVTNRQLTNGGDNARWLTIAFLETPGADPPTFTVSPTVTSQDASAYTLGYTADANATDIYVGAYAKDATPPTASELKAGTGARGTATEATTGAGDSIVLTPSDTPKFPLYDIYAVLEGAGGFSSVVALVDEFLDPPAGKQFVTLASVSATSPLDGASPTVVAGDIWVLDTTSNPGAYTITPDTAGDFTIAAGADETRQDFEHDVYDVSLAAYYGAGTVYVNNHAPNLIAGEGSGLEAGRVFKKDADQGTLAWANLVEDEEGDSFTFAVQSGALPTGWSLAANGNVTGIPTVYGNFSYVIRITDAIGDFYDVADNAVIGDEIPNVVGQAEATAITNVEAVANFTVVTPVSTAYSVSVPEGDVISQDPPGTTYAADDSAVTLTVSLGEEPVGALSDSLYGYRRTRRYLGDRPT